MIREVLTERRRTVMDELLTTNEVSARLKRSPETLRYWRARGTGPRSFRAGRGVLYREEDVVEWLGEQYQRDNTGGAA
jgi:DNA-binding transcriptional MerR regulator